MKKKKAFSIAEVVVAVMVFTIGVLSAIEVFPLHNKLSRISARSSTAIFLAQSKIEELMAEVYDNVAVGTIEPRHQIEPTGDFMAFQRQTVVEYVDGSFNPSESDQGLKKITTTVYWREKKRELSETLVTVISDR